MKKRIISIFLALTMLVATIPESALAARQEVISDVSTSRAATVTQYQRFKDMNESDWFYNYVMYAVDLGIFNGTSSETFDPYGSMTRSMFVGILGRLAEINTEDYAGISEFSDVDANEWYAPYVLWAVTNNITDGVGGGRFAPKVNITREEMAVLTIRFFEALGIDLGQPIYDTEPLDFDKVSDWAKDAVLKLWQIGLFLGDNNGNFNPNKKATRAEAATFSLRVGALCGYNDEFIDDGTYVPGSLPGGGGSSANYRTVRFETNGGDRVYAMVVKSGDTLASVPKTQKSDATFLGWYTDSACTIPFYQSDIIDENLTLYAKYQDMEKQQQFTDNKFVLRDQDPSLTFRIHTDLVLTEDEIRDLISLEVMDNTAYVALNIIENNGIYEVSGVGGFTPGSNYTLTLGPGLTFEEEDDCYQVCSFDIVKSEVINLALSDELIYIKSNLISDIKRNGVSVDSLETALVGNDETIAGTFTYNGSVQLGHLLCIYTDTNPQERDLEDDYSDDSVAYVKVTAVNGNTISYTSLNTEDIQKVLFIPDALPIDISGFLDEELDDGSFTIPDGDLDFTSYSSIGLDGTTTVDENDFLVFFVDDISSPEDYGVVTSIISENGSSTIEFDSCELSDIQASMDYYTQDFVSGEEMVEGLDIPAIVGQIEEQAIASGFAETAISYLSAVAIQTDGFKEATNLESYIIRDEAGQLLTAEELQARYAYHFDIEDVEGLTVHATLTDKLSHVRKATGEVLDGVSVSLTINATVTIDDVTMTLVATFVEEVSIGFGANGGAVWSYWGIFPYISDYQLSAYVDVYDYTYISLGVTVVSTSGDGSATNSFNVTTELQSLLNTSNEDELDAGLQKLFDMYGDMLETETDYITIVDEPILSFSGSVDPFHILAYNIELDFVIKANINIMLASDLTYMSGTRYIFWFSIYDNTAGNRTIDLVDESFSFHFYVMGALGIKIGLKAGLSVGLFSTDLDSIGVTVEFGPYIELYGYFFYTYELLRDSRTNITTVDEDIKGALYMEFGVYLEVKFVASVLAGEYEYEYMMYESDWPPILTVGTRLHVYDFVLPDDDDGVFVIRDITSDDLPSSYRNMRILDLKSGDLKEGEYPLSKFTYNLSNKNFSFNPSNGKISVSVPEGVQYMTCDLTLTWIRDKLTFSKYDMTSTVHLVWTNLSNMELNEKYTVSVQVFDGYEYTTVWSDRVYKNQDFMLPTEDDIKALIGYGSNTAIVDNELVDLVYDSCKGYPDDVDENHPQSVNDDVLYTFVVEKYDYVLNVDNVQNNLGVTRSEDFHTTYGEVFDLSSLKGTGTNNPDLISDPYTSYLNTTCSDADSLEAREVSEVVNREFAIQLREGTYHYSVNYVDNSCTVTYKFITYPEIDIPDYSMVIPKGSIPDFDYTDYVISQGVGYIVTDWASPIDKVTSSVTFVGICGPAEGELHQVIFDTNGGSEIDSILRYRNATVTEPLEDPTLTGYHFDGWYMDEGLNQLYDFEGAIMPDRDITLYAKWEVNTWMVTLEWQNIEAGPAFNGITTLSVTYGAQYEGITNPTCNPEYGFVGWYTEAGDQIKNGDTVLIDENHTLVAQYKALEEITNIDIRPFGDITYNGEAIYVEIQAPDDMPTTDYIVEYRMTMKGNGVFTPNEAFTTTRPISAGIYNVRVSRAEDIEGGYAYYEELFVGGLQIERATRNPEDLPELVITSLTYDTMTIEPIILLDCDVDTKYIVYGGAGISEGTNNVIFDLWEDTEYEVRCKIVDDSNYEDVWYQPISLRTAKVPFHEVWYIEDLYKIGSGEDGWDADEKYVLMRNLDWSNDENLNEEGNGNITWHSYNRQPLTGIFDGDGHTIENIYEPVLAGIGVNGQVMNLGVVDAHIGYSGLAGTIASYNGGTIENCYGIGSISEAAYIDMDSAGGIVGINSGIIKNCYFIGDINFTNLYGGVSEGSAGGIAGVNNGIIETSYFSGSIIANSAGGIVGVNGGTVHSCYIAESTVSISDNSSEGYVGGIAGNNMEGIIMSCYVTSSSINGPDEPPNNIYANIIAGGYRMWGSDSGNFIGNYSTWDVQVDNDWVPNYDKNDPDSPMGGEVNYFGNIFNSWDFVDVWEDGRYWWRPTLIGVTEIY